MNPGLLKHVIPAEVDIQVATASGSQAGLAALGIPTRDRFIQIFFFYKESSVDHKKYVENISSAAKIN